MGSVGKGLETPALVKVAEAGKAVKLSTATTGEPVFGLVVQALSTNEGTIVVGDKNVKAAAGTHAAPTRRGIALLAGQSVALDVNDAARVWVDATVNEDGVTLLVLTA